MLFIYLNREYYTTKWYVKTKIIQPQEYFSDGVAEEIITTLSKVGEFFVIARNSSFTYKGKPVKIQQVAQELRVRYVLEGSVRKSGDRVRITAQLIDAKNGQHLWADIYHKMLILYRKIISELP